MSCRRSASPVPADRLIHLLVYEGDVDDELYTKDGRRSKHKYQLRLWYSNEPDLPRLTNPACSKRQLAYIILKTELVPDGEFHGSGRPPQRSGEGRKERGLARPAEPRLLPRTRHAMPCALYVEGHVLGPRSVKVTLFSTACKIDHRTHRTCKGEMGSPTRRCPTHVEDREGAPLNQCHYSVVRSRRQTRAS